MADRAGTSLWGWRAGLVILAAALIFLRLLPSDGASGGAAAPDLVLCLVCAVVLRRPEFAPALLVAAVILVEDMLTMRPPGLWAALVLAATEFLRARAGLSRELGLAGEWLLVGAVIVATFAANRAVLALAMVCRAVRLAPTGPVVRPLPLVTIRPDRPALMRVTERTGR